MSITMDEEIKRWTARRKSALVLEIIQGKTTVAEASRQFDLPPAEIESWVEDDGAADFPAQGLAGAQVGRGAPSAHRGAALGGADAGRALGDRPVPGVGRSGWLADAGPRHGLPHPTGAGLAAVAQRQGDHGDHSAGAGPDHPLRRAGAGAAAVPVALG